MSSTNTLIYVSVTLFLSLPPAKSPVTCCPLFHSAGWLTPALYLTTKGADVNPTGFKGGALPAPDTQGRSVSWQWAAITGRGISMH